MHSGCQVYHNDISLQNEVQVGPNKSGHLCIKKPWPGQARTIWEDHKKFLNTYYEPHPGETTGHISAAYQNVPLVLGYYFTGDGALRDEENDYRITGRVDDVVNVKGHRIGTAEIECAMVRVYLFKNLSGFITVFKNFIRIATLVCLKQR